MWTGFVVRDFGLPLSVVVIVAVMRFSVVLELCVFLQLVPQTTTTSIKTQFITFIKLLHVMNCILCNVTRRMLVAGYRRFGTGYRSHFQGSILGLLEPSSWGR